MAAKIDRSMATSLAGVQRNVTEPSATSANPASTNAASTRGCQPAKAPRPSYRSATAARDGNVALRRANASSVSAWAGARWARTPGSAGSITVGSITNIRRNAAGLDAAASSRSVAPALWPMATASCRPSTSITRMASSAKSVKSYASAGALLVPCPRRSTANRSNRPANCSITPVHVAAQNPVPCVSSAAGLPGAAR